MSNTGTSLASLKRGTQVANTGGSFNADAWHAMQARDDQLIRDSVLHGYTGKEYVYQFDIGGTKVTGVSVVGARELATHYGGIKARIVASVDKTGSLFVFKSFEPLAIQVQTIPQLAEEDDFYEVVMEIEDIKTGNSLQVRKKETKEEKRRNGSKYARPHFDVIAESKAFRNGVLSIIPQNVIAEFEKRALTAGNTSNEKTIDAYRQGVVAYATKNAIAIDRQAVSELTYAEISGLGSATKESVEAFRQAADALGVLRDDTSLPSPTPTGVDQESGEIIAGEPLPNAGMGSAPFGLKDALAAVQRGNLDEARDMARSLSEPDARIVEQTITNQQKPQDEPSAQQQRGRGRGRQMDID